MEGAEVNLVLLEQPHQAFKHDFAGFVLIEAVEDVACFVDVNGRVQPLHEILELLKACLMAAYPMTLAAVRPIFFVMPSISMFCWWTSCLIRVITYLSRWLNCRIFPENYKKLWAIRGCEYRSYHENRLFSSIPRQPLMNDFDWLPIGVLPFKNGGNSNGWFRMFCSSWYSLLAVQGNRPYSICLTIPLTS